MSPENKVVISVAVVVDVDPAETGNSPRMDSISRRLRETVESTFSDDASVNSTGCIVWDWLNQSDTNFGRCADCNRLVSDYEKTFQIRTLIDARIVDGTLLCDECVYLRRERLSKH
tara:strand:- start:3187 stop:3534 length:348 start_codon:yes stop_codon:yes gene_type:complete